MKKLMIIRPWDRVFNISLLIAIMASILIQIVLWKKIFLKELIYSWVLNYASASFAGFANAKAVNSGVTGMMIWGMGVHTIRLILMVIVLGLAHQKGMKNFEPFLAATLSGYLVLMIGEVLSLHFQSIKEYERQ